MAKKTRKSKLAPLEFQDLRSGQKFIFTPPPKSALGFRGGSNIYTKLDETRPADNSMNAVENITGRLARIAEFAPVILLF